MVPVGSKTKHVAQHPAPIHGDLEHVGLGRGRDHGAGSVQDVRDDEARGLARAGRADHEHGGLGPGVDQRDRRAIRTPVADIEALPRTARDIGRIRRWRRMEATRGLLRAALAPHRPSPRERSGSSSRRLRPSRASSSAMRRRDSPSRRSISETWPVAQGSSAQLRLAHRLPIDLPSPRLANTIEPGGRILRRRRTRTE